MDNKEQNEVERLLGGVPAKRVVEILRDARARVADGWVQGVMQQETENGCCYCTVGAIQPSLDWPTAALFKENDAVCRIFALANDLTDEVHPQDDIIVWNDTPGRTQAEVLAAFDRAIQLFAPIMPA